MTAAAAYDVGRLVGCFYISMHDDKSAFSPQSLNAVCVCVIPFEFFGAKINNEEYECRTLT